MTPWVRRLVIANVIVFFVTQLQPALGVLFALYPPGVLLRPWTPFTYMFVHADFWHLFFNMLVLFFFGPRVEARLGSGRFLVLYLVSGLTGALFSFLTPTALIVGASGAVFGVELAFARYWPRDRILIWGIFPIEARWLIAIMTFVAIQGAATGGGGIAHWAHLGGFVGAAVYLVLSERLSPARSFRARASGASTAPVTARVLGDRTALERWSRIRPEDLHEVNRAEFERIRRRLDEHGIASLTPGDREFLDRFSARTT